MSSPTIPAPGLRNVNTRIHKLTTLYRNFKLSRKHRNLVSSLAKEADTDGGRCSLFVSTAKNASSDLINLGPALFSFPPQAFHRTEKNGWPLESQMITAFENRAWAVAKCGNPFVAAKVFLNVAEKSEKEGLMILASLVTDAHKDEYGLLHAIFQVMTPIWSPAAKFPNAVRMEVLEENLRFSQDYTEIEWADRIAKLQKKFDLIMSQAY